MKPTAKVERPVSSKVAKASDKPTEDNFRGMMQAAIRIENATCEIVVTMYDTKFKMQSDKSWVSNRGEPQGFCGKVGIETFHKNPATQDAFDWILEVRANIYEAKRLPLRW